MFDTAGPAPQLSQGAELKYHGAAFAVATGNPRVVCAVSDQEVLGLCGMNPLKAQKLRLQEGFSQDWLHNVVPRQAVVAVLEVLCLLERRTAVPRKLRQPPGTEPISMEEWETFCFLTPVDLQLTTTIPLPTNADWKDVIELDPILRHIYVAVHERQCVQDDPPTSWKAVLPPEADSKTREEFRVFEQEIRYH